jgi:hypothetical protein
LNYERLELNSDTVFFAAIIWWVNSSLFFILFLGYIVSLTLFDTRKHLS